MLLYFDTSIFLMLFKKEEEVEHRDCMAGLRAIMSRFEADKVEITTSTIAMAEIMPERTGRPAYEKIISVLNDGIDIHPVDRHIGELAALLRDAFLHDNLSTKSSTEQDKDSKLKTPDAIHLATSIDVKADYLCTIDKKLIKRGRNSGKLIEKVAGRKIEIIKPPVPEFSMRPL